MQADYITEIVKEYEKSPYECIQKNKKGNTNNV